MEIGRAENSPPRGPRGLVGGTVLKLAEATLLFGMRCRRSHQGHGPYMRHGEVSRISGTVGEDSGNNDHELFQLRLLVQMIALGDVRELVRVRRVQPC